MKELPNIWCNFEPIRFCNILDHNFLTIEQTFQVKCLLYTSIEKDKLSPIQLEQGEI